MTNQQYFLQVLKTGLLLQRSALVSNAVLFAVFLDAMPASGSARPRRRVGPHRAQDRPEPGAGSASGLHPAPRQARAPQSPLLPMAAELVACSARSSGAGDGEGGRGKGKGVDGREGSPPGRERARPMRRTIPLAANATRKPAHAT